MCTLNLPAVQVDKDGTEFFETDEIFLKAYI